jgi:DNA-binding CsgD family transcriptional regulator
MQGRSRGRDRRACDLVEELDGLTAGTSSPLGFVVPAIHNLVGMDKTAGLSFTHRGGDVAVQDVCATNVRDHGVLAMRYRDFVPGASDATGTARPSPCESEAHHRNRVYVGGRVPALASVGLDRHRQMCVAIYDGSILVAWVGGFQEKPFERRQRHLFRAIVPALRRRFTWERQLRDLPRMLAALDGALDSIAKPAFLVGKEGEVLHASASARTMYDRDRAGVRQALADAVHGRPDGSTWETTPFGGVGPSAGFIAILRSSPSGGRLDEAVRAATLRWTLTTRQSDVLNQVAWGLTNAEIADALAIGKGTVEFHVKALFDKAGVDNRARLIGRLFEY